MARTFSSGNYLVYAGAVLGAKPGTVAMFATGGANGRLMFGISTNTLTVINVEYGLFTLNAPPNLLGAGSCVTSFAYSQRTYTNGVWQHCAGTFTSTTSRQAFVNGVSGTANTTSRDPTPLAVTCIGTAYQDNANNYTTYAFPGSGAEVAVWNVTLTTGEINALAKGFNPKIIRPASLVAYWPLGGHFGESDVDRWKSRYDMTAGGSPTWATHNIKPIYPTVG